MKKLILSVLAGALVATAANAQEETTSNPLVLGGSVDSYYRTTLNTSDQDPTAIAPGSSFANGVGFNIGMFNLIASKEGEKAGFVADVVFGPRGDEATFANANGVNGTANLVNQAYVYYNINDMLTFTLGNFNTFLGYEVISPSVNFNYSTSYMFSYGPFSHTGAKLDIAATDQLSFMVAALNPTDIKTLSGQGNNMYFGAQVGYELDNGGVWLNYLGGNGGPEGSDTTGYHQIDLTTGFNVTEELYLGLNATFARQKLDPNNDADGAFQNAGFYGVAGYAQYAINESLSIGGRAEYFSEKNSGSLYGGAGLPTKTVSDTDFNSTGAVMDLTLSANIKVGDLTFIPELRADFFLNASDDVNVASQDGTFIAEDVRGNSNTAVGSIGLAAVYTF